MSQSTMQVVKWIMPFLPHLSLSTNAWSVAPYAWYYKAPGYDSEFAKISGISPKCAKWFIEAKNRQPQDPVIVYLHGGAYCLGIFPTMAAMLLEIWRKVGNDRLSILWVDYTLTGKARYPQQLKELVLVHNELQRSAENIVVLGDSAGGHLIINFLRHGKKEAVEGVPAVMGPEKVTTAVLISPGVDIEGWGDALEPDSGKRSSPVLNPCRDHIAWDSILPSKLFISYGELEPSRDNIERWIQLAGVESEIFIEPRGHHDSIAISPGRSRIMKPLVNFLMKVS